MFFLFEYFFFFFFQQFSATRFTPKIYQKYICSLSVREFCPSNTFLFCAPPHKHWPGALFLIRVSLGRAKYLFVCLLHTFSWKICLFSPFQKVRVSMRCTQEPHDLKIELHTRANRQFANMKYLRLQYRVMFSFFFFYWILEPTKIYISTNSNILSAFFFFFFCKLT